MPPERTRIPISFESGVNLADSASVLEDGEAATLQNWEPYRGGLRARRGWTDAGVAVGSGSFPTTRIGRGLGTNLSGTAGYLIAAHAEGSSYQIWQKVVASSAFAGSWYPVYRTGTTYQENTNSGAQTVAFAVATVAGAARVFVTGNDFSSSQDDIKYFTNAASAQTMTAVSAVGTERSRCLAYHKNILFAGGSQSNPERVWVSNIGDPTTFTVATDYIDVGYGDGYPVEEVKPYLGDLLVGKGNGVWRLSGSGMSTFALESLDGGECAPGRSLVPTPVGCFILGNDSVYLLSASVDRISAPLDGTYTVPLGGWVSGAWWDDLLHISVSDGTYYVYDPERQAWWTEATPDADEGPNLIQSSGKYLFATTKNADSVSLVRGRLQATTTPAKDASLAQTFTAKTGLKFFDDTGVRDALCRHVYLRIRQHGTTSSQPNLTATVTNESGSTVDANVEDLETSNPQVYGKRIDFGAFVRGFQLTLSHAMESGSAVPISIEKAEAELILSSDNRAGRDG